MNASDPQGDEAMGLSERLDRLRAALPGWLEARRWFADKGRGIVNVEFEDAYAESVSNDLLVLAIVRVAFQSGADARYFVPATWTEALGAADAITLAPIDSVTGAFIDAADAPWFGRWLIDAMLGNAVRANDVWSFAAHPTAGETLAAARTTRASVMRAEQSNTSLRFGDALMVKLVRRLQPGPNPEEEMLRALADMRFSRVPPYAGRAAWRRADGQAYPLALAQAFVPNQGDGWSWMLQRIRGLDQTAKLGAFGSDSPEWLLGRRTGELHAALSRVGAASLAPEPVSRAAIELDVERVQAAVVQTVSLLREGEAGLPGSLRDSLPAILTQLKRLSSRAAGFRAETGTRRIRVHGDYHLGQTLRTPEEDWVIIDFEGEPARPVAERRQKTSALKDVAGMLRSFAYARGAAERERPEMPATAAAWEAAARQAFLAGYRDAVCDAPVPLVPSGDEAFAAALAAWELDKALYEIAYEVRNRPDWVELPLASLLPDLPR